MGDYFKPLRRKIGVLTLVMACVFAAGWVRSLSSTEWIAFQSGTISGELLGWMDSHLIWIRYYALTSQDASRFPDWSAESFQSFESLLDADNIALKWQYCGFWLIKGHDAISMLVAPLWFIVVPLTLLSAWLLLSKPRAKAGPTQV